MIYDFKVLNGFNQCELYQNISFSSEGSNNFFSVLVNPVCDLVIQENRNRPKANYFLFLGIIPVDSILNNIISSLKITKKQRNGEEAIDVDTFNDLITILKQFINGSIPNNN